MCTVLLPLGVNPIAVDKYIISYHIISYHIISYHIISYHIISYHISYHIISYHMSYRHSTFCNTLLDISTSFDIFPRNHQSLLRHFQQWNILWGRTGIWSRIARHSQIICHVDINRRRNAWRELFSFPHVASCSKCLFIDEWTIRRSTRDTEEFWLMTTWISRWSWKFKPPHVMTCVRKTSDNLIGPISSTKLVNP
jgi:hypothetical protein